MLDLPVLTLDEKIYLLMVLEKEKESLELCIIGTEEINYVNLFGYTDKVMSQINDYRSHLAVVNSCIDKVKIIVPCENPVL